MRDTLLKEWARRAKRVDDLRRMYTNCTDLAARLENSAMMDEKRQYQSWAQAAQAALQIEEPKLQEITLTLRSMGVFK